MNIGFDLGSLIPGASGGITQLTLGYIQGLLRWHSEHCYRIYVNKSNMQLLLGLPDGYEKVALDTARYYSELESSLKRNPVDILFRCYPVVENNFFPMSRQVVLVPDIQHEFFPKFFDPSVLRIRRWGFHQTLALAGGIVAISEYAKSTLEKYPWTACPEIFVATPALPFEHESASYDELPSTEKALVPEEPYFFFPANLWEHKNHIRLFESFRIFHERVGGTSLLLTGHDDRFPHLIMGFEDLPISHLGFVSPQLVQVLHQRSLALTYFSLYEGFGIPLLEAFHACKPVLCSNTTSLPEVGGRAVLSCDPENISAMAELMCRVHMDATLRDEMAEEGKKQLDRFTWQKSCSALVSGFSRVLERAKSEERTGARVFCDKISKLPLVSIVTPSFNQGRFLRATIESVLSQDYPNIEYIVMDGGSTDESVQILKEYGDQFYWISESDNGQTHAINKGIALAKGEILAYLNSDDVLYPGAVRKVVEFFRDNPDVDLVYGEADYINEDSQVIGRYNTDKYSFERIMRDCCICQPATFWKKRVVDIAGAFDESLSFAMDYDYWLRVDRVGGLLKKMDDVLAASRMYSQNKTMSCRHEIFEEVFSICQKHGGYISMDYYIGRSHCRLVECSGGCWKWLPFKSRIAIALGVVTCYSNSLSVRHFWKMLLRNIHMSYVKPYGTRFPRLYAKLKIHFGRFVQ